MKLVHISPRNDKDQSCLHAVLKDFIIHVIFCSLPVIFFCCSYKCFRLTFYPCFQSQLSPWLSFPSPAQNKWSHAVSEIIVSLNTSCTWEWLFPLRPYSADYWELDWVSFSAWLSSESEISSLRTRSDAVTSTMEKKIIIVHIFSIEWPALKLVEHFKVEMNGHRK